MQARVGAGAGVGLVCTWHIEAEGGHRHRKPVRLPLRQGVHRGEGPLHAAALEAEVVEGRHREEAVRVHAQHQRPAAQQRPHGPLIARWLTVGEGDHLVTPETAQKLLEGGTQPVPAQQARAAPPTRPLAAVKIRVRVQRQEQHMRWAARQPAGPRQEGEEGGARTEVEQRPGKPAIAIGGAKQVLEVERRAEPASDER